MISAEDLIAGAAAKHAVEIPEALLPDAQDRRVLLRPLTVRDLRLIAKAVRDNDDLSGALMVRQALVDPALSLEQIGALPAGLLQFLLNEVNRISGITATEAEIVDALEDPLVQASLLLSRELGWTPEEIGRLTMGETMLHVAALRGRGG
ncbi:MAG: hypothetical protein P8Y27_03495 [Chromatiaceae bacterium]